MSFETKEAVVSELWQYTVNEYDLHKMQQAIIANLATKKARGVYKRDLAVKGFMPLVEAGAKKYAKEFGGTWHQMFDVPTRRAVAKELVDSFEAENALGNYDHLLPKKYQKPDKASAASHARMRSSSSSAKWNLPEGLAVRWAPANNAFFVLWPASAPLKDQQVLKVAGTDELHSWLRDRYGAQYGLASRSTGRSKRRTTGARHEAMHEPGALRSASDRQLREFHREEKRDLNKAKAEGTRRGLPLHSHKRSDAQLDREIARVVPSWRGGR